MLGAGYQTTELLFAGLIAFPVHALAYQHRLFDIPLTLTSALALWVLTDLCFYWMHRSSHRVRWFWAAHVTHHSSERMNFSTAMRQNATNIFNGGWLFYVPLSLLGFNPVWIGVCYALSLVYQFFIHTTLVGKLHPVIEYLFNTPNHHRVHHARNPGYIDTNYGGVLSSLIDYSAPLPANAPTSRSSTASPPVLQQQFAGELVARIPRHRPRHAPTGAARPTPAAPVAATRVGAT
ncbi:sterol desaturase family protein [Halopseudomonas pachastrellae]|nr:sterol desaturase family protein [Halopseudomonas pachastrellae]